MSDFRDYEVVKQLGFDIRSEIVLGRKPGSKRVVLLKSIKLDALSPGHGALEDTRILTYEELKGDPRIHYLDAIKAQGAAGRAKDSNIAPIHDLFPTDEGVCFATDYYQNGSLRNKIQLSVPSHPKLQNVIGGILRGLSSLKSAAQRGHGNLHANNVMLGGDPKTPLRDCRIFLTDVAPLSSKATSDLEKGDLRSVGQMLYQLVMRKVEERRDDFPFPVRSSPEWEALGEKGNFWLRLCNRLMDPDLAPGAESLEGLLQEIGRPRSARPIWIAAIVVVALAAGVGGWLAMRHTIQPTASPSTTNVVVTPPPTNVVVTPPPTNVVVTPPPTNVVVTPPPTNVVVTPPPTNVVVTPPPTNVVVTPPPTNVVVTPPPTNVVVTPPPPAVVVQPPSLTNLLTDPANGKVTIGQTITWKFTVEHPVRRIENPVQPVLAPQLKQEDGVYTLTATPGVKAPLGAAAIPLSDGGNFSTNLAFEIVAPPPPQLSIQPGQNNVEAGTPLAWTLLIDVGSFPRSPTISVAASDPALSLTQSDPIHVSNGVYKLTLTAPTTNVKPGPGQITVSANDPGFESSTKNLSWSYNISAIAGPTIQLANQTPLVMADEANSIELRFTLSDPKVSPELLSFSLKLSPADVLDQSNTIANGADRSVTLARRPGQNGQVAIAVIVKADDRIANATYDLTVKPTRQLALALFGPVNPILDVNAAKEEEVARIPSHALDPAQLHFEITPPGSPLLDSSGVKFEPSGQQSDPTNGFIVLTPKRGYGGTVRVTTGGSAAGAISTNFTIELSVRGDIHPPSINLSSNAVILEEGQTNNIPMKLEDDYFKPAELDLIPVPYPENIVSVKADAATGVLIITGLAQGRAKIAFLLKAPNGATNANTIDLPVTVLPAAPPRVPIYTNEDTGMILKWVKSLPETTEGGWVGQDEVTQGQFQHVMGTNPSVNQAGPNYPVENLTLQQATDFCDKLTAGDRNPNKPAGWRYQLPSETQWNFFAEGTPTDAKNANFIGTLGSHFQTTNVGSFLPNRYGLCDVLGNVCEMTATKKNEWQVCKGGSFFTVRDRLIPGWEKLVDPVKSDKEIGFRVILVPPPKN